jgi:hypothetical protein
MKQPLLAVLVAIACLPAQAATSADELKTLRTAFECDLLGIIVAFDRARSAVQTVYEAGLENVEADRQKAGDLEGMLLVQKERERFQAEKTYAAQLAGESNANLVSLQNRCRRAEQQGVDERARKILLLLERYTRRLEDRKKALVVAGDIDGAVLFKAEIERAASLPEVKAAQDHVNASAVAVKTPPAERAPEEKPAATMQIDKRFKVYTGRTPPAPPVDVKRITLRTTKLSSLASNASVTAQLAGAVLWVDASTLSAGSYDAAATPVNNLGTQGGSFSTGTYSVNATAINGKPALQFNGTSDFLSSTTAYTYNNGNVLTVFIVGNRISDKSNHEGLISCTDGSTDDNTYRDGFYLYGWTPLVMGRGWDAIPAITPPGDSVPFISTGLFTASRLTHNLKTSLNNTSQSLDGTFNNFNISYTVLGKRARSDGRFANINIGELLIYNSALSTADRTAVEAYLAAKWAIR